MTQNVFVWFKNLPEFNREVLESLEVSSSDTFLSSLLWGRNLSLHYLERETAQNESLKFETLHNTNKLNKISGNP